MDMVIDYVVRVYCVGLLVLVISLGVSEAYDGYNQAGVYGLFSGYVHAYQGWKLWLTIISGVVPVFFLIMNLIDFFFEARIQRIKRSEKLTEKGGSILKDQRGNVVIFTFLITALIIFSGFVVYTGIFLDARAKVQTIADASALAGASTAEVQKESEYEMSEENGETVVKEKVISTRLVINPEKAKDEARFVAALNGATYDYWKEMNGRLVEWDGEKISDDTYRTWIKVELKPGLFYPVWRMIGRQGDVPVYIDGVGKAAMESPPEEAPES